MFVDKLSSCLYTIDFFIKLPFFGLKNRFKSQAVDTSKKLLVLANGPSLKEYLNKIQENKSIIENCELSVVNDFANLDLFTDAKPLHYTISDPMFFHETRKKDVGLRVMNNLAGKVTWPMFLYVNRLYKDDEYMPIIRQNHNIRIVYYNQNKYRGAHQLRNWVYKHGWGNGEFSTVILNSLYVAITQGYKNIELYGVDHNFFDGLMVNDDNIPCYIYTHYFDQEKEVKPMLYHYHNNGKQYMDMPEFVGEKYNVFRGHQLMAAYAVSVGASILNCTKGSLIDSYPRVKSSTNE